MKKTTRPDTLEECFQQLDFLLKNKREEIKAMTEQEFTDSAHFQLGMWIRNEWIRHGSPRLTSLFANRSLHIDDTSDLILTSYHRYLTNKEIEWEEQIKTHEDILEQFNKKNNHLLLLNEEPGKEKYPKKVSELNFVNSYQYTNREGEITTLHIATEKGRGRIWLYNYFYGWIPCSKEQLKEIKKNLPLNSNYVIQLFNPD